MKIRAGRAARIALVTLVVIVALVTGWIALRAVRRSTSPAPPPPMSVLQAIGPNADDGRFARALHPRDFHFPDDHGPHSEYRNEWWYWTGNLDSSDGRHFGYQFTVFRSALEPAPPRDRTSAWATSEVYMAHFAICDAAAGKFYAFERTSRAALDLAGAAASPFRVSVLDWSAVGANRANLTFAVHLSAKQDEMAIDLELEQGKPVVLHGDRGLSQKGARPGNASYYYSLSRMPTEGSIAVGGQSWRVRGESWMDREWSTSALEPEQVGWDWLALQLDDSQEIMFFRLRRADGQTDPKSSGTLIARDGTTRHLGAGDVSIEPLRTWKSARSGAVYPTSQRLRVPGAKIDVAISPLVDDQELDLSFRYWEGAVRVEGSASGHPIAGRGYLELTGYGESARPER